MAVVGWVAVAVGALVILAVLVLVVMALPDLARYRRLRRM